MRLNRITIMTTIKTWNKRCEEHPDHQGVVTEQMVRYRMQEEIDELRAKLEAVEQSVQKPSFDDALRIARGCTDYGGGYRGGDKFGAYQHGIGTVINALTAASLNGLEDYQVRTLHAMGAAQHASDCAVHNEPAYQAGPCDCGATNKEQGS